MDALAALDGERCEDLRHPSMSNLIVSIIIVVGMFVSYLPQHVRIIARRTSEGISPYFILLGTTSATAGLANVILLPQSRQDVACCKELDTFQCMAGLLGIAQLGAQWICVSFLFVLFLVFFRYNTAELPEEDVANSDGEVEPPTWQEALVVAGVVIAHGLVVIVVTAVLGAVAREKLALWANICGVMAALLAAVQYIPQIWTTYHLRHVGSLSIPMMLIQTPGGFLFAGSLFARYGWAGWSSWGIFVLTASMQGILLCMAIHFEVLTKHLKKGPDPEPDLMSPDGLDDETPGPYTGHPEHYATTPEQLGDILDRQELDAADETQPLLRPGGIGSRDKNGANFRS